MPYNTALSSRIEQLTSPWDSEPTPRIMFGGICYFMHGNMAFGIWKDELVLRLGVDQASAALEYKHVRPFDVTGRPMRGWVMVSGPAMKSDSALEVWLEAAKIFVDTLPPKTARKKRTK